MFRAAFLSEPPCSLVGAGRLSPDLLDSYKCNLTKNHLSNVSHGIWVSSMTLSLQEYIYCCQEYCLLQHTSNCTKCTKLMHAARIILSEEVCSLSSVFHTVFPGVSYSSSVARQRLSKLPLAFILVGEVSSGCSEVKIVEKTPHLDYKKLQKLMELARTQNSSTSVSLTKSNFHKLLSFAQSRREKETLTYAVYKASGMSATAARKSLGVENLGERVKAVEDAVEEAISIRECIDSLAHTKEKAALISLGITVSDSSSESSDEVQSDEDNDPSPSLPPLPSKDKIVSLLKKNEWNWFAIAEEMENLICTDKFEIYLEDAYNIIPSDLPLEPRELLEQSHNAYVTDRDMRLQRDLVNADAINGFIIPDTDVIDVENDLDLDLTNEKLKAVVEKRKKAIQRHSRYLKKKAIADRNFLKKKASKTIRGILQDCPNIGEVIETFVTERNIGADAWRRTGVLTFDGNVRVGKKVTFSRIREHLEEVFKRKISYGTVVELCIARNRRRRSAKRYRGVARVTCRRARKGFVLKYNPDAHWSAAFYRGLNKVQFEDGLNIVNLNRDDCSGFRLDTITTHKLHKTHAVQGKDTLTTHTDYVNRYPSTLQTTSYNFSKTSTTPELCAGVVKAAGLFSKNPAQHSSDIAMLEKSEQVGAAFVNPCTNVHKQIECVRVDGASDEGPTHEEVQFFWTLRHFNNQYFATVVTTRNSGCSYLNRVELQNGCLALGHANLFIPSTLCGPNIDQATGKIHKERFKRNMEKATEVYINRANESPCGETCIHLLKGSDSSTEQALRVHVLQFLKGSKKQRENLKKECSEAYDLIEKIWTIRGDHIVKDVPTQYVFSLICCFKPGCAHPVCKNHNVTSLPLWYEGGPPVSYLPLPIPDPLRPWGDSNCTTCTGQCHGHFLKPNMLLDSSLSPMRRPPSAILKEFHQGLKGRTPTETELSGICKRCLLPNHEVEMWLEHLKTVQENRKRGAIKAAETRRQKKKAKAPSKTKDVYDSESVFCGVCHEPYTEFTDKVESWIECDGCLGWAHYTCAGLNPSDPPSDFLCAECKSC